MATLSGAATLAAENDAPSGTLRFDRQSVAVLVGVNRGNGILQYGADTIPITVAGVSLLQLGATNGTASGKVYDLHRVEDFDGTYAGAGAGLTIAGGGSAVALKNDKGVTVVFLSANQGLDAELATTGVRLEIDRPRWAAERAERAARRAEAAAGSAESAAARIETASNRIASVIKRSTGNQAAPQESPTAGVRPPKAE